jgi:hypothetical protein
MARFLKLIWVFREADSFCKQGWTGFRARGFFCPSGKSLTRKHRATRCENGKQGQLR